MKILTYWLTVAALITTVAACGKSDEEKRKEADAKALKGEFHRSEGKAY
jgi:hypothetical protein